MDGRGPTVRFADVEFPNVSFVGKRHSPMPWEAEEDSGVPCTYLDTFRVPCDAGHLSTVLSSEGENSEVTCVDEKRPGCPGTDGNFPLVIWVDGEFVYGSGTAWVGAESCRVPLADRAECSISWDDITCFRGPWAGFKGCRFPWPEGKDSADPWIEVTCPLGARGDGKAPIVLVAD